MTTTAQPIRMLDHRSVFYFKLRHLQTNLTQYETEIEDFNIYSPVIIISLSNEVSPKSNLRFSLVKETLGQHYDVSNNQEALDLDSMK